MFNLTGDDYIVKVNCVDNHLGVFLGNTGQTVNHPHHLDVCRRLSWEHQSVCQASWPWISLLLLGPCGFWEMCSSESTTPCLTGTPTVWGSLLPNNWRTTRESEWRLWTFSQEVKVRIQRKNKKKKDFMIWTKGLLQVLLLTLSLSITALSN